MKNILLKTLILRNFKGVIDQTTINFFKNTSIYGANESGKSTLNTAFMWLLTGNDEYDRTNYEIKNTSRKELNDRPHEVEAIFDVNGIEIKLRRVYLEKWTKPKGRVEKIFEGHIVKYYYNDVERSATEYQQRVDDIIPPRLIKLLTNPYFFNSTNSKRTWKDQRNELMQIAGIISDSEIVNSIRDENHTYSALLTALTSGKYKDVEEWRKELVARKNLLKKSAIEFNPRIDEAKRSMPEEKDWSAIEQAIGLKEVELNSIDDLLSDASKELAQKQKALLDKQKLFYEKQNALTNIVFKIKNELSAKQNNSASIISQKETELKSLNDKIALLRKQENDAATNKTFFQNQIQGRQAQIARLREEWIKINAQKFSFDETNCICPTCQQQLPTENIDKKKSELEVNFNNEKARQLKSKVDLSNVIKAEIKQLEENIAAIDKQDYSTGILNAQAVTLSEEIKRLRISQIEDAYNSTDIDAEVEKQLKGNSAAIKLSQEIKSLTTEIETERDALNSSDNSTAKINKIRLANEIADLRKDLAEKETIERTKKRIEQLENDERANAQAIADIERQEFEIETYERAKNDILEKRVNDMFKYVKFKLFKQLVNGGIDEDCVCLYNDVPYPTLNTAAKLLAGLDILNTFSNFYEIHAPVFCDNRESVSWIPEIESQIISLFVSPDDKKLRVENADEPHYSSLSEKQQEEKFNQQLKNAKAGVLFS